MQDEDVTGDLSGVYLKRQDFANGDLTFKVASVDKVTFEARNGKPAEQKWALTFASEPVRKFSLNKTNLALMAKGYGSKTGRWVGKSIELFLDESVNFGGQLIGGMRIRIPKRRPAPVVTNETSDTAGF
jgi:hypothetical protein